MPISFRCPDCGATIRVRDELAGRSGKCPKCRGSVTVPHPAEDVRHRSETVDAPPAEDFVDAFGGFDIPSSEGEALPARSPRSRRRGKSQSGKRSVGSGADYWSRSKSKKSIREQVMSGFRGPIKPVPTTILYRIGIVVAACFVVILPVLYVTVIAAAGYGVYWHATENVGIAGMGVGRARLFAVLAYVAPIIAGSVVVLFMLKPLVARRVSHGGQVSLNRDMQPLLYDFVEKICDTVGAPYPSRIDVVFDINASASYGSGFWSLFRSDLVLTIGLPLVAGMSLQQFASILAHEFGHFSQGAGMRVSWVVRSINHWFAYVVYSRDALDSLLIEVSEDCDFRVSWIFYLARLAVFVSRIVLWCFMLVSHAATCWLLRQMEYDADQYKIRLAGSKNFEETLFRVNWLVYGITQYFHDPAVTLGQEEKASGNPIRDFIRYCDSLSEHDEKCVRRRIRKAKTGWLDTHPSDSERVAVAERAAEPGVFRSRLPAEVVVRKFDRLCESLFGIA